MKITKKARQEAIEQLEQFADVWIDGQDTEAYRDHDLCTLAYLAQDAVYGAPPYWFSCDDIGESIAYAHIYLEAAALIRDGWNPGDPVELLNHGGE